MFILFCFCFYFILFFDVILYFFLLTIQLNFIEFELFFVSKKKKQQNMRREEIYYVFQKANRFLNLMKLYIFFVVFV